MILIQTLWRCARTLITTTTLSLLFHYSLSLLLCSTLQGRRKQGAGGGKLPLQLLSDMLTLFQSGSRLCPPVIALISTYNPPPTPPCSIPRIFRPSNGPAVHSGKTDIISYHCCMLTGNDIANDVNHACVTVRLSNQCFVIHRVLHKNEVSPDWFDI